MKIIERSTIVGAKYCETIGDFIPYATPSFPDGWILEQDGTTPHTSRQTKDFFAKNSVHFRQRPPNSPDNNPVENAWTIPKSFEVKKNPKKKTNSFRMFLNPNLYFRRRVEKLMSSIPTRLDHCRENEGNILEKWTGTE